MLKNSASYTQIIMAYNKLLKKLYDVEKLQLR